MHYFILKDAISALRRLDDFFSHEEIQPAVRYPVLKDSDYSVIVVSIVFISS